MNERLHGAEPRRRAPDLARLPIAINPRAVSLAEGVRAALSVAVIVALHEWLGRGFLVDAALASMLTCLCDPGGPIHRRAPLMLLFAVLGASIMSGGALLRGQGIAVALPAATAILFLLSFLRVYGQPGQQIGMPATVLLILSLDHAVPDLATALPRSAAFLAGSIWAIVLTLVIWPVYPFRQARAAVAASYRSLAALAADMRAVTLGAPDDAAAWDRHARTLRRTVRESLETARSIVLDTVSARGAASHRATQSLIRLEASEQIFGALIAMATLVEGDPTAHHAAVARLMRRLVPLLIRLADAIEADQPPDIDRVQRAIANLEREIGHRPTDDPLRVLTSRLCERLRIAVTLSRPADFVPAVAEDGTRVPLCQRAIMPVSANLNWRSDTLRHACRSALVTGVALGGTMAWPTPYGHWLTITVAATLQPVFALTYVRALERVGGTLAGGLIGALVGLVCTTPLTIALAMFPLSIIAFAMRAVSFGLFMAALTPLVILLVEATDTAVSEWVIAASRAALTAAGGALAIVANHLLWPQRRSAVLAESTAIAAHGTWAVAELARLRGERGLLDVVRARRAAGLASNTLEVGLNQALIERRSDERERVNALLVVDAALRRAAGCILALRLDRDLPPADALLAWGGWIDSAICALAAGRSDLPPRPTVPASATLLRLVRQIDLIAGTMGARA
ncbi:MAG: FUSC family protein [Acetobacteraceae bacterium]